MATAEQIKALLKTHSERDDQRFYSIALQVAASEARVGHHKLAKEIKSLVEKGQSRPPVNAVAHAIPFVNTQKGDLNGLLEISHPQIRFSEMVLSEDVGTRLHQIILEQRQKDKLAEYGLTPRRKILFIGPPGTGKTMSAALLATELKMPLYKVVLDSLITRYMGETASKLRLIFNHIAQTRAVYLFDEFDAIGAQRAAINDVGEIRRVLNSFLLFFEQDISESVITAATNHPELLDKALYRRFDDIVKFEKPNNSQIKEIIKNKLASFSLELINWELILREANGLSCAEIVRACEDAAKTAILHNNSELNTTNFIRVLKYRRAQEY
jgi:SpoVK/Ycf46/Vps4 family AAA+-type ATPase